MRKKAALIFCLTPLLLTVILVTVNAQPKTYWAKTYGRAGDDTGARRDNNFISNF